MKKKIDKMDSEYVLMPGRKKDHMVLVDQTTWMYYHKNGYNRYRCYSYVTNGCVAEVVEEEDGIFVPTETPYVHPNHKAIIHQMMLFQAIKVRLENELRSSVKEIYDEEVERMNIWDVSYLKIRSSLQRVRRSRHPPNPLTIREANDFIMDFSIYRNALYSCF